MLLQLLDVVGQAGKSCDVLYLVEHMVVGWELNVAGHFHVRMHKVSHKSGCQRRSSRKAPHLHNHTTTNNNNSNSVVVLVNETYNMRVFLQKKETFAPDQDVHKVPQHLPDAQKSQIPSLRLNVDLSGMTTAKWSTRNSNSLQSHWLLKLFKDIHKHSHNSQTKSRK